MVAIEQACSLIQVQFRSPGPCIERLAITLNLYNQGAVRKITASSTTSSSSFRLDTNDLFMCDYVEIPQIKESSGDPARVQVLYERAVSELPVSSDLWMGYTSYLDRNLKVPSLLRSVYYRATRNCTWFAELWVLYLLSLERIDSFEEELRHVFERAIQCSFPTIKRGREERLGLCK